MHCEGVDEIQVCEVLGVDDDIIPGTTNMICTYIHLQTCPILSQTTTCMHIHVVDVMETYI